MKCVTPSPHQTLGGFTLGIGTVPLVSAAGADELAMEIDQRGITEITAILI